jgi:hypothetical protein
MLTAERVTNRDFRVAMANRVLDCFAEGTVVTYEFGRGVTVSWPTHGGKVLYRRWQTRGQDFYPTWSNRWGHGGTACTALSQLVRWIRGQPVLPLSTWRYWFSEKCWLARNRGEEGIKALVHAGYPDVALCVLCGNPIEGGLDWWSLDNVTGPCCGWTTGCRQKPGEKKCEG